MMNYEGVMKEFGKAKISKTELKAMLKECAKKKMSVIEFLYRFIMNNADDEFSDYMSELLDKYGLTDEFNEELGIEKEEW